MGVARNKQSDGALVVGDGGGEGHAGVLGVAEADDRGAQLGGVGGEARRRRGAQEAPIGVVRLVLREVDPPEAAARGGEAPRVPGALGEGDGGLVGAGRRGELARVVELRAALGGGCPGR
ncbi:MAG: hypothetical protein IPN01_24040 [Deltaproteobacteria bacterium]|nr:hypothetical protein [Deltaproteobacteria bacterium]